MDVSCARIAPLAVALCAAPAMAGMIDQASLPNGSSFEMLNVDGVDVEVSSVGGTFKKKSVNGVQGTGVSGGAVDAEIDNEEAIIFEFDDAMTITSLSIAHLFTNGEFGDQGDEVAAFIVAENGVTLETMTFELEATTATVGTWNGLGVVTNDSIATEAGGGAWTISGDDIFGFQITSLSLVSGNAGNDAKFGDYGFRALSFVPTPGAAGVLAGLGLGAMRRRNRK